MNKLIKTLLAALLVVSMAVPAFAEPADETDVSSTNTEATETLTEAPAETDGEKTDEEIAETTDKEESEQTADGEESDAAVVNTPRSKFSDVNTTDFAWARPYINAMTDKGLIAGYEDGTYRPDNDVTRLETLSLFARAMGSNDEANAEILEIAHDRYDNILKNYGLKWGEDDIVYLMYKGALKKTDLDTYIRDEQKDEPMKRYEAAIIITKALGGEEKALEELGVVLSYKDAREVPTNAIQYVAYATDAEIMQGMGDDIFSPNTPVKRSQIAVMLSRTVDKTNYSFDVVNLTAIDTDKMTITVTDSDGEEKEYEYTEDTKFKSLGDDTQPRDMLVKVNAVITLSDGKLAAVDTVSSLPDETVVGKYVSYASTQGKTTLRVTDDTTGETNSYECASDLTVTYQGSPATVRSFTKGDVIQLELKNGKIVQITGGTKTVEISGAIVENVDIEDGVKITISHGDKEYDGKTYEVSSDVSVRKNDVTVGLDSIYKGDKVKLTLQYNVITKIQATSTKKTVEGTIRSLTIASPQSTMDIKVKDDVETYEIPKDVEILINGEEGTLYDFRVGDLVKITVESDAITRIVATSTQESTGNITGVITAVNTSYGVVSVKVDGVEDAKQVFCKDDSTTFISIDGKTKKMKDLKVGQTIDVRGTVSNGVFVGKLVIIVSE